MQPTGLPYNISPKFQVGRLFTFKFITPNGAETIGGFKVLQYLQNILKNILLSNKT